MKFIILEIFGGRVFPILYDFETGGPARIFTEEEAVKELIKLRRNDDSRYRFQLVSLEGT